jgi:hypothetical protein
MWILTRKEIMSKNRIKKMTKNPSIQRVNTNISQENKNPEVLNQLMTKTKNLFAKEVSPIPKKKTDKFLSTNSTHSHLSNILGRLSRKMSTQLITLSKNIFTQPKNTMSSKIFFKTQSKNEKLLKHSTVENFHHEIFNIVQKNIVDQNTQSSKILEMNTESMLMNSSENLYREKAEEVLEANTYNNDPYSTREQKKKDLKDVSEMIKKHSGTRFKTEENTQDNINEVHIRKLQTR